MLLEKNNIVLNLNKKTKLEILKYISEYSKKIGVTEDDKTLFEDLRKRESEVSTGLSDGFAIPHAKSSSIKKPNLLFIKLQNKIDWEGTLDDNPVECIFCLLAPEKDANNSHLLMLSKIATNLLEDDFKIKLKALNDKDEILKYLLQKMKEEN